MNKLGQEYVKECIKLYGKSLHSLGSNLEGFLTSLIGLCDLLKTNPNDQLKTKNDVPNLLCNRQDEWLILNFYTNREPIRFFVGGVVHGLSQQLYNKKVTITNQKCDIPNSNRTKHRFLFKYQIKDSSTVRITNMSDQAQYRTSKELEKLEEKDKKQWEKAKKSVTQELSGSVYDSKIGVAGFCAAFPWHFICDRKMALTQMGSSLVQVREIIKKVITISTHI